LFDKNWKRNPSIGPELLHNDIMTRPYAVKQPDCAQLVDAFGWNRVRIALDTVVAIEY